MTKPFVGIEPTAVALQIRCSTSELKRQWFMSKADTDWFMRAHLISFADLQTEMSRNDK